MTFAALVLAVQPVRSELIWQADFSGYTTGQAITLSSGGGDDTFSSLSAPGGSTVAAFDGGGIGLTNGLSLKFETTVAGSRSLRLNHVIADGHKLIVLSFDRSATSDGNLSLSVNALNADDTRAHGSLNPIAATAAPSRFTMVINLTGGNVTLGNGSILTNNSIANYCKTSGGSYAGYNSVPLTHAVTGVMLTQGIGLGYQAFDNVGLWVSTNASMDTLNGVSVMQLDAGTSVVDPLHIPSVWDSTPGILRSDDFRKAVWDNPNLFTSRSGGKFLTRLVSGVNYIYGVYSGIGMAVDTRTGGLVSLIKSTESGVTEMIGTAPSLPCAWRLEVVDDLTGDLLTVDNGKVPAPSWEMIPTSTNLAMVFNWDHTSVTGLTGNLTVRHTISLEAKAEADVSWTIAVTNQLTGTSLWRLTYPVITHIGYSGASDVLRPSGYLFRGADEELSDQLQRLNFLSITTGSGTLLLHSEESLKHRPVESFLQPGGEFHVKRLLSNAGTTNVYAQEFRFNTTPISGDWFDAVKRYEGWTTRQPWYPSNSLARRGVFSDIDLWVAIASPYSGDAGLATNAMSYARELFTTAEEQPIGAVFYNGFRTYTYAPHALFPTGAYNQSINVLNRINVKTVPYISMLYSVRGAQDKDNPNDAQSPSTVFPEYDQLTPGLVSANPFNMDGVHRIWETYWTPLIGNDSWWWTPMCYASTNWQNELLLRAQNIKNSGAAGVYLDMANTPTVFCCFSETHGHERGGGSYSTVGKQQIMSRMKDLCGSDFIIFAEGRVEDLVDSMDAGLSPLWGNFANYAPVYEYLYSQYTIPCGMEALAGDGSRAAAVKAGLRFLYGYTARLSAADLYRDTASATGVRGFLQQAVSVRRQYRSYFTQGRLVRAPAWKTGSVPPPLVCRDWGTGKRGTSSTVSIPSVERAVWRLPSGRTAVFICNFGVSRFAGSLEPVEGIAGDIPVDIEPGAIRVLEFDPSRQGFIFSIIGQ